MSGKIGLLYVKSQNTVQVLAEEITTLLGARAQDVVNSGVEEQAIKPGKLTPVAMKMVRNLEKVNSLIVITDNAFWDGFWSEHKIRNKLEELLWVDITFILIVGCNLDQKLIEPPIPSSSKACTISEEDLEKYLEEQPPIVCHMVVSMREKTEECMKELSKQIVDKFYNQVPTSRCPTTEVTAEQRAAEQTENPEEKDESENADTDFSASSTESDDDTCYDILRPGLCLYIGVLKYDPEDLEVHLDPRGSSGKEFDKMKNSFERLGCYVKKKLNPTDTEAQKFLEQGKAWCEELEPGYLVLIISTHGQEVPLVIKEDKPAKPHPSGIKENEQSKQEMVHQLFFSNGKSLLTRDIVKMFDACPSLAVKPRLFFIQACRSGFGIDGRENFDPGVMVNVITPSSQIEAEIVAQKPPDAEDASGAPKSLDTADAKRSTAKLTEEDKEARLQQIKKWNKIAKIKTLCTHITEYTKWLSEHTGAPQTPSQETSEETAKLAEALTVEGLTFENAQNVLETCKGYEVDVLDFFFPEPIISDPAPCTPDSVIMFASAPGKEAYNNSKRGGWLITNLEDQLKETLDANSENIDLLAELTKVSRRMAFKYETETDSKKSTGHKSVPCLYHKLCKDVIICPENLKNAKELLEKSKNVWLAEFLKWEEKRN